jgi:hypothetical protein
MDRHSSTMTVSNPAANHSLMLLSMCHICLLGGRRARATFHDAPLPSNMLPMRETLSPLRSSSSSPLLCDMRTLELRALMLLSEIWRCVWIGDD